MFSSNSHIDNVIDGRVSDGFKILWAIGKFTRDVNLSVAAKLLVYVVVLVLALVYDSEYWVWMRTVYDKDVDEMRLNWRSVFVRLNVIRTYGVLLHMYMSLKGTR